MFKRFLSIFIFIFLLVSCSGTIQNRKIRKKLTENIKNKKYQAALKVVKNKNFYENDNSKLLKNLEIATVNYLNGNYYQSLKYFEKSKEISDELYTISIKKKLESGWDANLDEYYGERYERSFIRFYLSLINYNLYQQGFYEEYKDENNNVVPKKELTDAEKRFHLNYARSIMIEWDSLLQSMKNESLGKSIYKDDMIAKVWGAFVHSQFENNSDRQIALHLYKDADVLLLRNYNMYSIFNEKSDKFNKDFKKLPNISYQQLYKTYIKETEYSKDLREFLNRNEKNLKKYKPDNLVIIIKDSLISPKTVKKIEIPLPVSVFGVAGAVMYDFARLTMNEKNGVPYILIEFPEITPHTTTNKYKISIFDKYNNEIAKTDLTLIEPISDIARKNLDDEAALVKAEVISRITAKYIAAIVSSYAIYKQDSPISKLTAMGMFMASSKLINETSRADIRHWSTLASDIYMGGARLKSGNYKLAIYKNDKKIKEQEIKIQKDKISFIDINE